MEGGQVEIDLDTSDKALVLKYPVEKETIYSQFSVRTKVTPGVSVTVPAGTFRAYLYDFSIDDADYEIKLWAVPGLGPVKSVYGEQVYVLKSYKLQ